MIVKLPKGSLVLFKESGAGRVLAVDSLQPLPLRSAPFPPRRAQPGMSASLGVKHRALLLMAWATRTQLAGAIQPLLRPHPSAHKCALPAHTDRPARLGGLEYHQAVVRVGKRFVSRWAGQLLSWGTEQTICLTSVTFVSDTGTHCAFPA